MGKVRSILTLMLNRQQVVEKGQLTSMRLQRVQGGQVKIVDGAINDISLLSSRNRDDDQVESSSER